MIDFELLIAMSLIVSMPILIVISFYVDDRIKQMSPIKYRLKEVETDGQPTYYVQYKKIIGWKEYQQAFSTQEKAIEFKEKEKTKNKKKIIRFYKLK